MQSEDMDYLDSKKGR